jgi:hypothetical protein
MVTLILCAASANHASSPCQDIDSHCFPVASTPKEIGNRGVCIRALLEKHEYPK